VLPSRDKCTTQRLHNTVYTSTALQELLTQLLHFTGTCLLLSGLLHTRKQVADIQRNLHEVTFAFTVMHDPDDGVVVRTHVKYSKLHKIH
jgi:hypothetical protein